MKVATYTKTGNKSAELTLDKKYFGAETNVDLIAQAYNMYLGNQRQAHAKTLTRAEVSGGGRKPWRQKGTGNARFGSTRVPIWRHGGVAHGPTGLQNYHKNMPAGMAKSALKSALSSQADKVVVIEKIDIADGKTKSADALLNKLGVEGNVLVVLAAANDVAQRALRNLAGVAVTQAAKLNVYAVMNADNIVVEKAAIDVLIKRLEA
jgi:large subunit ribosomal protein L4